MKEIERLALETCAKFLTATRLREVCRRRGFPVPSGPKDALTEAVAVRMLSPTGAAESMASLSEEWQFALHAVALSGKPPGLRELLPVIAPGQRGWEVDYRQLFTRVADGLLTSGVVLVRDEQAGRDTSRSRYEHVVFVLPDPLRPLLPPLPIATAPFPGAAPRAHPLEFARAALSRAVDRAARGAEPGEGLLERLSVRISFENGILGLGGTPLKAPGPLLAALREEWLRSAREKAAATAASHVLAHLPPGMGVSRKELGRAVARLGVERAPGRQLLEEGVEAGLLVVGTGEKEIYRAAPPAEGAATGPISFTGTKEGVLVDVAASGLAEFLEVAALSRAEPRADGLWLRPDPVCMGRALDRLPDLGGLARVAGKSAAFARSVAEVRLRAGRTVLHTGLAVLRVDEPLLLASLTHGLPDDVRPLGGPWLAALEGSLPKVVALAAREGFQPRRIP